MSARPGLCGGQPAMVVPTAISKPFWETGRVQKAAAHLECFCVPAFGNVPYSDNVYLCLMPLV